MSLDRDELAARATAARAALLSLCEALSALVPVAPATGPDQPKAGQGAEGDQPRRTVGAVVRALGIEWIVVRPGNDHRVQRALDAPDASTFGNDAEEDDEFVRWATREECERHGIPYVARPLPGAPLAAPSPAATPAAWVPSVGDVVKHVSESDKVATTREIRVVVSTNPIRWVYVENGVRKGESGPTGWGNDVRFVRRATSSERAAAGLPVEESAGDEERERDAARTAWASDKDVGPGESAISAYVYGWLARARVAAKGGAS